MAADPRWSQQVATPGAVGTEQARQAQADPSSAPAQQASRWATQVQPGGVNWSTLTGQNLEGTNNAFDTTFWERATAQDEEQSTRGMSTRWTRPDATGVVMYNDEANGLKFGDVFLDGAKQGNLREGYAGLSREQSTEMLARMALPREVWAKAYESEGGKPLTFAGSVEEELDAAAKRNTENYAKGLSAADFEAGVRERAEGYEDNTAAQIGNVAAGAAGGAAVGAGLGSFVPVIGTGIGAAVGGLIGGFGAWLNRDEQFTQIAQAQEQLELASQQNHGAVGWADTFSGWAGYAASQLNPTRNILHGAYDAANGQVGDQTSEYYNTEHGFGMMALDFAAMMVDGFGTFGTSSARRIYTATMGANAATGAASVTFGAADGNIAFNPYSGTYEDIGLAGQLQRTASVGIDAIQTAAGAGVSRVIDRGASSAGGFRIGVDASGAAATRGLSITAALPSEAAVGLSARALARRSIRNQGLEDTRENLARETARYIDNLTTGRSTIATAVVNGFGEGSEEFVQAILGATAFGETPTFNELFEAARSGFAMGAGMGVAIGRNATTTAQRYRERSNAVRALRGEEAISDEAWNKLSTAQQAEEGTPRDEREQALLDMTTNELNRKGMGVAAATYPEMQRAMNVAYQRAAQEARNSSDAVESSRLQVMSSIDWAPEDYVVGLDAARADVRARQSLMAQVAAQQEVRGENGLLLSVTPEERAQAERIAQSDLRLLGMLDEARAQIDSLTEPAQAGQRAAIVRQVNDVLREMWAATEETRGEEAYGARRSASALVARYPLNSAGSFQLGRLQISPQLTEQGDQSTVLWSDMSIPPQGGDYDGDRNSNVLRALLPDDSYNDLRRGAGQLTSDGTMLAAQPYTSAASEALYVASQQPGTTQFAAAAQFKQNLKRDLNQFLNAANIDRAAQRKLVSTVVNRLADRQPEALKEFIDTLATVHAPQMRALAEALDASPYLRIMRMVEQAATRFNTDAALRAPQPLDGAVPMPRVSRSMPRYRYSLTPAASDMTTALIAGNKYDVFRMQTVLKYNARREATETQPQEIDNEIAALVQTFTALNDGIALPGEQAMMEGTAVQQRTQAWLQDLATEHQRLFGTHTRAESMVLLAGAQVTDLERSTLRPRSSGQVSFLQAVMHDVITGLRRTYSDVVNNDAALASRLSSLDNLTVPNFTEADGSRHAQAGNAFVEVFSTTPIYDLLGEQGAAINTYTVRGLRDTLVAMRPDVRAEFVSTLKEHPSYAEVRDVAEGASPHSPYRVLVDHVTESASQQLSEQDGIPRGQLTVTSTIASQNFAELHDSLRKLVNVRGFDTTSAASIREYLAGDLNLATRVLEVMEARGLHPTLERRDPESGALRHVEFQTWMYDVLAEPRTAKAEMMLLRFTLENAYAAIADGGTSKLTPYKVNDRILRLWLDLDFRANDQTDTAWPVYRAARDEFMRALYDPQGTVESFIRTLNTDYRFRDERDPAFMAWNRDRSVVEASRYGSGVSEVMEGTEMREALRDAAAAAKAQLRQVESTREFLDRNSEVLSRLREARDNPRSVNRPIWDNFTRWIDQARDMPTMVGASIWINQAQHINEILGHMGVKGMSPDNVSALGAAVAAQLPVYDAAVGQVLASSTSGRLGDVLTDPGMLTRTDRRMVMPDGTVVDWTALTPEAALDLLSDENTAGIAARALGMTAWDYNADTGQNMMVSVLGDGITGLVSDPISSVFGQGTSTKLRRLMMLESKATVAGGPPIIPVLLAQQMNIREAASASEIDPGTSRRERMAIEILEDIADSLQALTTIEGLYVEGTDGLMTQVVDEATDNHPGTGQPMTLIHRTLLRAGRAARQYSGAGNTVAGLLPKNPQLREIAESLIERYITDFSTNVLAYGIDHPGPAAEALAATARRMTSDYNRIDDVASPLDVLLNTYSNYTDPRVQSQLVAHAAAHGDIMRATPWAADALRAALNPNTPRVSVPAGPDAIISLPDLTTQQWETVARAVIAFTMHTSYGVATTSDTEVSVFPSLSKASELSTQRGYWDPTFVDPGLDIFADGIMRKSDAAFSPLLAAQIDLVQSMGAELPTTTAEQAERIVSKLITPRRMNAETGEASGTTGQWHALVPALMHSAVGAVMSSASPQSVSMAGINPDRLAMLTAGTKRDWTQRPDDTELSTAVIPAGQLVSSVQRGDELDSRIDVQFPGQTETAQRPLAQLEGRVVRSVRLVLPDGTELSVLGSRYGSGLLLPANTDVLAGDGGVLSLDVLGPAIGNMLQDNGVPSNAWGDAQVVVSMFHPDTKPLSATTDGNAFSHNPWFDGVIGGTDAAFSQDSLLGTLFFGLDGTIPAAYETALGAIKKLTFALQQVTRMPENVRESIVASGLTDMAGTVRRLTDFILKQKIDGKNPLGASKYNAIRKLVEMLYVVRDVGPEGPRVLSAEQVIGMQARGEEFGEHAEVVGLPLEHLLRLMGELGAAVPTVTPSGDAGFTIDVSRVEVFRNFPPDAWTNEMFGGFVRTRVDEDGTVLGWATQDLLDRPELRGMAIPRPRAWGASVGRQTGRDFFSAFRQHQQQEMERRSKSDPKRWQEQRNNVLAGLENQNIGQQTMQAVQLAGVGDMLGSVQMLRPQTSNVSSSYDTTTAWKYVHRGARSRSAVDGVLTHDEADRVMLGDEVVVDAATFLQADSVAPASQLFPEAREVLSRLAGHGATITLPPSPQAGELRSMMMRYLRERGFVPTEENAFSFEPAPTTARSQAEKAFESTLNGPTQRTSQNRVFTVLSPNIPVNENSIFSVNGGLGALEDYFVREVGQTARYADYAPAQNFRIGNAADSARAEVINRLLPVLGSADGRMYLRQVSGLLDMPTGTTQEQQLQREASADLDRAIDDLRTRLRAARDDSSAPLIPTQGMEFGTGDLVPLVSYNPEGELLGIHLYRHGHNPVPEEVIHGGAYPAGNEALGVGGARLTIDQATVDPNHTTHRGTLVSDPEWLGLQGFVAKIRVKLSDLGSKVFETMTGMKWTTTVPPEGLVFPTHTAFAGMPVLGLGDYASPQAKTSDGWWLNTPSHIIESVGFDTMPYLVRALTGIEYTPETANDYARGREMVTGYLRQFASANRGSVSAADLVTRDTDGLQQALLDQVQAQLVDIMDAPAPVFTDQATNDQLADLTMLRLVLNSLAAGADLDTVISAPGYLDGATESHTMHPVFTTLLHQLPMEHPARLAFVEQINNRMQTFALGPNGVDRWELNRDFTWTQHTQRPDGQIEAIPAMLAFPEIRNTGHNSALTEQALDRKQRGNSSETANAMLYTAWDAASLLSKPLEGGQTVFTKNPLLSSVEGRKKLAFNRGTTGSPKVRKSDSDLPLNQASIEHVFTEAMPARRALSVPIDTSRWYTDQGRETAAANKARYDRLFDSTLRALRLQPSQSTFLVEMIRAVQGRPAGVVNREEGEHLTYKEAMQALRLITANAERGDMPTHGGAVATVSRSALHALWEAGYPLRAGDGKARPIGDSWDLWVEAMLSETFSPDPRMRAYPAVTNIVDGLLYEYRGDVKGLPETVNQRLAPVLRFATNDGLMVASPIKRRQLDAPSVQSSVPRYTSQELATQDWMIEELPQEARSMVERRMTAWESKNKIGNRKRQSPRSEAIRGANTREELARTNVAMDMLQTAYVAKTMLNPGLWVSAFIELAQRGGSERAVSLLSGENLGARGFTPAQRQQWKDTVDALADSPEFYRMVYSNTNFQQPGSASRLAQRLQSGTNFLSAMVNDPTWGTRATTMASRFMEAAWSSIETMSGEQHISVEQFLDILSSNPEALATVSQDAVNHGYARIEYARGLQDNLAARSVRRATERVIGSGGPGTNTIGTLLLRLPTLFFRFRTNTIINLAGLQAPHAVLTTLLDGRTSKPGGLLSYIRGDQAEGDPTVSDTARIEDSYDLTRAIIRSGVSHTQLFLLGAMISAAGFGGDDDEQRFLDKLRRYQVTPVAQDPLALENDFRNADAWFVDFLPAGMGAPSWILKMFVSPAMGVARFHETGDFRQVWWGFYSAIGDMPLLNMDNVLNSWEFAQDLQAAAEAESLDGNIEATSRASQYLITTLATLENMLFESSFASMVYQGADEWDRDPYKKPLLDSSGVIQREGAFGTPRETDVLQDYIGADGEPAQGYVGRTEMDATLHSLAERRPVFAWLMSTIMQDSTYIRYNMPVKTRDFKSEALSQGEAGQLIVSIFNNEIGGEQLTTVGAEGVVRGIHLGTIRADDPSLQGVFIPNDMREALQNQFLEELTAKYLDAGYSKSEALSSAKTEFYGQGYGEPEALGVADILWGDSIPRYQNQQYMQLNTTYVTGPNGRPVATGLTRSVLSAFGLDVMQTYHAGDTGNLSVDPLLNSVDDVRGANLGMRALSKVDETWNTPTAEEIGASIDKSLAELSDKLDALGENGNGYGSGWRNYGRGGYRRGGGSGGYSSFRGQSYVTSFGGDDQRLNTPRRINAARLDDLYTINTGNPIIRRATIRRERFSSERGRLNQWQ